MIFRIEDISGPHSGLLVWSFPLPRQTYLDKRGGALASAFLCWTWNLDQSTRLKFKDAVRHTRLDARDVLRNVAFRND